MSDCLWSIKLINLRNYIYCLLLKLSRTLQYLGPLSILILLNSLLWPQKYLGVCLDQHSSTHDTYFPHSDPANIRNISVMIEVACSPLDFYDFTTLWIVETAVFTFSSKSSQVMEWSFSFASFIASSFRTTFSVRNFQQSGPSLWIWFELFKIELHRLLSIEFRSHVYMALLLNCTLLTSTLARLSRAVLPYLICSSLITAKSSYNLPKPGWFASRPKFMIGSQPIFSIWLTNNSSNGQKDDSS